MKQRFVVRVSLSVIVCTLLGLALMVAADGASWTQPDVRVVTTTRGTLDGRLLSTSTEGLQLLVDDQCLVVPWRAVVDLSLREDRSGPALPPHRPVAGCPSRPDLQR